MRILPEDTNEDVGGYDFEDVEEIELTNKGEIINEDYLEN